jgi:hypothetical protein
MIRVSKVKAAIAAVTVAGATAAAVAIPASPAVAFSSGGLVLDIVVQSPAQLIAKGAAVAVPVEYTCLGAFPETVSVSVSLTERVGGNDVAFGGGSLVNPVCTGEIQSATINATPEAGKVFRKGDAFAQGFVFGCADVCGQDTDAKTIAIQN